MRSFEPERNASKIGGLSDRLSELSGLILNPSIKLRNADAGNRTTPRDIGDKKRGRNAEQADEFRIVLFIDLQNRDDHLDFAAHAVIKKRADRAVNQDGRRGSLLPKSGLRGAHSGCR